MIYRDVHGFIVDQTGDGGDSANRAGLVKLFNGDEAMVFYEPRPGILVRHPSQVPWNNPNNFSRDQLIPFMAGLWKSGPRSIHNQIAREVFWAHAKRGFFCQNIERDVVGSRKYPYPHSFINDKGEYETRTFDFRDFLGPNDIWFLILACRLRRFYIFAPLGYFFLGLSIVLHCLFNRSNDEGQIIAQAKVGGRFFVWLYKKLKPRYAEALYKYWVTDRNMQGMYEIILAGF